MLLLHHLILRCNGTINRTALLNKSSEYPCMNLLNATVQRGEIMNQKANHFAIAKIGIVAIVAIFGLSIVLLGNSNPNGSLTGAVATDNACVQLSELFHDHFDCCGAGSGAKKCTGLQTASEASGCGTLSCATNRCPCFQRGELAASIFSHGITELSLIDAGYDVGCSGNGLPTTTDIAWAGTDENTAQRCINGFTQSIEFSLTAEQLTECQNIIRTECQ